MGEHVGGEAEGRRALAGVVEPAEHHLFGEGDGLGPAGPGPRLLVGEDGQQCPATNAQVWKVPLQALEPAGCQGEQGRVLDGHIQQGGREPVAQVQVVVAELGDGPVQDVDRLPALAAEEQRLAEREGDLPAPLPVAGEGQRFAEVVHGGGAWSSRSAEPSS